MDMFPSRPISPYRPRLGLSWRPLFTGRDRPADREGAIVAQEHRVAGQVADDRVRAAAPIVCQGSFPGLRADGVGPLPGVPGQHLKGPGGNPVLR